MTAVYFSTLPPVWTLALQWIWFAGMVAIAAGLALDRYARVSGRPAAKKAVPGVVVAVVLMMLVIGGQQGVFSGADAWAPYCDSWLYYTNFLCWFQP